jgi:hypothetical protein
MSKVIPEIDSYNFGRIVIDGKAYNADVIVTPDGVKADWWRKEGHSLCPEDLDEVLDPEIEVVIIGCGAYGALKVPEDTRRWLEEQGKDLVALPTQAACERYNELSGSGKVIAGLNLTC